MSRTPPATDAPPPLTLLLVAVAVGGALGSLGRWAATGLTPAETGFPWTTFALNVSGSFLLALVPAALAAVTSRRRHALAATFLGPGLLGGWTTLSAYAEQGRALLASGSVALAGAYLAGTLAACLVAVDLAGRLVTPYAPTDEVDE